MNGADGAGPARLRWPHWVALSGVALLLGAAAAALVAAIQLTLWPYPNENFEGGCVLAARLWAQGRPLYWAPADGGLPIYNYPPLYVALLRVADNVAHPFLSGRLIGLAALLGAAATIGLALRRGSSSALAAVVGATFVLILPVSVHYAAAVRVDALASFFSLASVAMVWRFSPNRRGLAAAAALGVAAWLTKQTAVLGPAAAFLWLAWSDRRSAALFAGAYGIALATIIAALELATGGAFLRNVLAYSMTPFSGERLASFLAWSILRNQPIHALMWAGFAGGLIVSLKQGWRSSPVPIYLLLNAASLAWLGKAGSSLLYFYEFGLAGALGLGWALASLERRSAQRAALATLAIAALAAAGLPSTTREPFAGKNAESERRVVDAVKQARGPLLLEDPGYAALANRTDVEMVNPFLATQLFARRLADPTPLIAAVRAGRFGLIVLASPVGRPSQTTRDRYPAAMLAAIAQSYELHDAFGENFLYAPRTGPNAEAVSGPK